MKKKSILIIDDDPELSQELTEILKAEGYHIKSALTSAKALKILSGNIPDLIILDYKLPGGTGVELLREIRKINAESKVLFVSGKPFIEKLLEDEAISDMISGTMSKPFDLDQLFAHIKKLA